MNKIINYNYISYILGNGMIIFNRSVNNEVSDNDIIAEIDSNGNLFVYHTNLSNNVLVMFERFANTIRKGRKPVNVRTKIDSLSLI
jgi:hypothetical protein